MKKKIAIIGICILLMVLLFIPRRSIIKDGGSVVYQAVLYSVWDIHAIPMDPNKDYVEGTIIEILGIEIYNDVEWH